MNKKLMNLKNAGKLAMICLLAAVLISPLNVKAKGATADEQSTVTMTPGQSASDKQPIESLYVGLSAYQDENGVWTVPVNGEIAAGVYPDRVEGNRNLTYYTFEWTVSDNLKFEDFSDITGGANIDITGVKLGDGSFSVKITDKEDPTITKTIETKVKVVKSSSNFFSTKDPIKTEDILGKINSGNNDRVLMAFNPEVQGTISKDIFAAAKENAVNLRFNSFKEKSQVLFEFAAADITNPEIDFNPNFEIGVSNKDVDAIVPADAKALVIDFAHNGALPGKATVSIGLNEELMEKYGDVEELHVYHIDNETGKLVRTGTATVSYGMITFEITHCSQYALTVNELTEEQTILPSANNNQLDNVPNTGI